MSLAILLRPEDETGFKHRFWVGDQPTAILLRKGGGKYRWQAIAEMENTTTAVLFEGASKMRIATAVKVMIGAGFIVMLKRQSDADMAKIEIDEDQGYVKRRKKA